MYTSLRISSLSALTISMIGCGSGASTSPNASSGLEVRNLIAVQYCNLDTQDCISPEHWQDALVVSGNDSSQ